MPARRAVAVPVGRRRPVAAPRRPLLAIAAMGSVTAVAYKMGKGNTQKVEEYTGKPVDTLTDEELEGLATLRDHGVITEEEFEAKKAQLLGL